MNEGLNDLHRLVETIGSAALSSGVSAPRRPWLPELPSVVDLGDLATARRDEQLVFALSDDPTTQSQPPSSFDPDRDGHLAVIGTGGSGKSTVLRTLAAAAGFTVRGGPVQVYALDFGARGLSMLEGLPHVGSVIPGDDVERVQRLIRWLRQTVDERSVRYASVQAASITEFRAASGEAAEPRLLLLLDGYAAFRQSFDTGSAGSLTDAAVVNINVPNYGDGYVVNFSELVITTAVPEPAALALTSLGVVGLMFFRSRKK